MKKTVLNIFVISKVCILLVALVGVGDVRANPGYLAIRNHLNGNVASVRMVRNDAVFPTVTDGFDTKDIHANTNPGNGYPNIKSVITGHKLWDDYRPENSVADYDIELSSDGSLPSTQPNWLKFDFYIGHLGDYEFNGQSILFQSDRLPYGHVVDINRAREHSADPNEVDIFLIDVPSGTSGEYGSGILTIGTRLLADLDDSKTINYIDFVLLFNEWQQSGSGLGGDITGSSGIPDGTVDIWDLLELVNSWMDSLP